MRTGLIGKLTLGVFAIALLAGRAPAQPATDDVPAPRATRPAEPVAEADAPDEASTERPPLVTDDVAPVPPSEVVNAFLTHVAMSADYPAAAREFVTGAFARSKEDRPREFISLAYAVLSKEFARGVEAYYDDDLAESAETFKRLADTDDPFLAWAAADLAGSALLDLDQIERCHEILDKVLKRHGNVERYSLAADNIVFMYGYCLVHMLAYEEAAATLETFLKRYPESSERLRITATQMLTELSRRIPERLGDVRDLLAYAERRIGLGETGRPVQRRQAEAVALLDALIEEAENQEQNQSSSGGQNQSDNRNQPGPGPAAQQSTLPGGPDRTGDLRRTRARPGETWGKMPPREREQILQSLQRQFPSQYRDLLEQYYQQLAKDQPK